jgi:hypothetical protein
VFTSPEPQAKGHVDPLYSTCQGNEDFDFNVKPPRALTSLSQHNGHCTPSLIDVDAFGALKIKEELIDWIRARIVSNLAIKKNFYRLLKDDSDFSARE